MSPRGTRVVGYTRCSTQEQADSGAGLAAQRAAIEAEAERKGWTVVAILEDAGVSGKSRKGRKALDAALTMVEAGAAEALVVAKVDRLARSMIDFLKIMEQAEQGGWSLIALDAALDMTTPTGRAMARMLSVFADLERDMISQRTKDGLAAKKAAGVQIGRPRTMPDRVVDRIRREHAAGRSLSSIAKGLNDDAIPTAQGGAQWHTSTVKAIVDRF